jgi:hypothetical protein
VLVRIRLLHPSSVLRQSQQPPKHQALALALASLLTPAALLAFTMAFWRMAADLHWTGEFFISDGILSHWQTWLAGAGILLGAASLLNRLGHASSARVLPHHSVPLEKIGSGSAE